MGQPVIAIQLVDATPYRLRYLLTDAGNGSTVILTNRSLTAATPDLRGDCARAADDSFADGAPLLRQVSLGVASQAEARHVMQGHQSPTTPTAANIIRAHCLIQPRTVPENWNLDVNEGAAAGDPLSAGFSVVTISSAGTVGGTAYLDIHLTHTRHDSQQFVSLVIQAPTDVRIASNFGMGDWHDGEWAIARGCTKVSPGCEHCTAEILATDTPSTRSTPKGPRWADIIELFPERLVHPAIWPRPMKVFVGASTDFWHVGIPDDYRAKVWAVCRRYPQHTFGFLTKRALEMQRWVLMHGLPVPDNVWLGVTVENNDYRYRLDALLRIPVRVHYAQCEPLLGPIDLTGYLAPTAINWVVAGPEWGCGDHARPCDVAWMRKLRDDCSAAGIPFFTKHLLDGRAHRALPGSELDRRP